MDQRDINRRGFVVGSAAAAATLATGPALAQDVYPSRPVTFVNPFPPGGATDVVGRPFAAAIEPFLKQPAWSRPKPAPPARSARSSSPAPKPDGYTLLLHIVSISGFAEVDKLFGREPKFTRDSFIPIARFTEGPMVLVVNDKQPYQNLKELVDDAKKRPNGLIFSSSGLYGALHLPAALFMQAAGIQMRHLPTAGGGPALNAILGNNAQVLVSSIAAAKRRPRPARSRRWPASRRSAPLDARRADHEGARLRHRVLALGRAVCAQGHAATRS